MLTTVPIHGSSIGVVILATVCRHNCYIRAVSLRDLKGLVDEAQRKRLQQIVMNRLADDRDQDECRYLMRFWWQLSMSYTEVTIEELREHLHEPKLAAVEALIAAMRSSADEVQAWIAQAETTFPVVMDRGARTISGLDAD